jgi:hypothetical protein
VALEGTHDAGALARVRRHRLRDKNASRERPVEPAKLTGDRS